MAHKWLAYERPSHLFAFSLLVIALRALAIVLPLLFMALLAAIIRDGGEPGALDLLGLMFI